MGRSLDPIVQRFFPNFHAGRLQKSQKQPKNRVFGLVEPVFSIFRPIFGVIFIFCAIARIFLLLFLCHRCRRYFTVIFQYFPDVERQRSPDGAHCATYGATPCSTLFLSHLSNRDFACWNSSSESIPCLCSAAIFSNSAEKLGADWACCG